MPVITRCPNPSCAKKIGIAEKSLGKRVMCPFCKTQFTARAGTDGAPRGSGTAPKTRELKTPIKPPEPGPVAQPPAGPQPRRSGARRPCARRTASNSMAGPIGIISLSLVVILVVVGVIVLANRFSASLVVSSPQEALDKLASAVTQRDERTLASLMTERSRLLARHKSDELRNYLRSAAGLSEDDLSHKTPLGLLIETLKTPEFNIHKWKYRSAVTGDESGELIVEDKQFGRSFGIPMARLEVGWRLQLAEFCLKRIEMARSAGALSPSTEGEAAAEAAPETQAP